MASDTGGCVLLELGVFRMTYDDLIRHLRFMVLDRYNCNEEAKDKLMKTAAYAIEELQRDARLGRVVWRFIDRMNDTTEQDTAAAILKEFVVAIDEAMRESDK